MVAPASTPSAPAPSDAAPPPGSETLDVGRWQVVVTDGHAVLPEGMTHLSRLSRLGRTSLVSVAFPRSLVSIGDHAFDGCSSLVSVDLPASLASIGWRAFADCSALARVTFPAGLTTIDDYAFRDCSALARVTLPAALVSIGIGAFDGCSSLTRVTFPAGFTFIGSDAFYRCSSLTRVTVPDTATIGDEAFESETTVLRLPPAKMRRHEAKMRWYEAVDRTLAFKRFALEHKDGLLGWLERANIRLGSYGPDGAARKRDREEFEGDFGHSAAAGSSGA